MHPLHIFTFAGLATALTIKTPANLEQRDSAAAPQGARIAAIDYSGSGCTVSSLAGQDLTNPSILSMPQRVFTAQSGQNNTKVVETRTTCQTIVKLSYPSGWQFSLTKANYYGRVVLSKGAEATSRTTYSFTGDTKSTFKQFYFDGPYNGLYFRNDRFDNTTTLWSPCGSEASLNFTSEARVAPLGSGNSRPASMEIFNPLDGKLEIAWRTCTK
ncbi:hypothetical protein QBC47DRAFT_365968 [Echria macrotheca]|uniref:Secreted protein n=1 Tax=Echria macrotheca TaxID=438768 RepID=A0AAJ0F603_9PEZI|nr:hypothetical protein QBC47DRAFT_365968 [Echria macrotheca]